jgi:hypothetical protein
LVILHSFPHSICEKAVDNPVEQLRIREYIGKDNGLPVFSSRGRDLQDPGKTADTAF